MSIEKLFGDWQESLIWSCLQGVMGNIYPGKGEPPASAMAMLGDFCYFAGTPDRNLVAFKPQDCDRDFMIMVPQSEEWASLIEEVYGERAKRRIRYAIKKEPGIFRKDYLEKIMEGLRPEYQWKRIDREIFSFCEKTHWCRDWVRQYPDYETFQKMGLGVVILKDGEPVSGASSYSSFQGGIEVEIGTREDCRRQGLALICGAGLILECEKRGLYPSWDAQNKGSANLAEKLGYHFSHQYPVYEIWGY